MIYTIIYTIIICVQDQRHFRQVWATVLKPDKCRKSQRICKESPWSTTEPGLFFRCSLVLD